MPLQSPQYGVHSVVAETAAGCRLRILFAAAVVAMLEDGGGDGAAAASVAAGAQARDEQGRHREAGQRSR